MLMVAPARLVLGLILATLVSCAALRRADRDVKDWTSKVFRKRDPDRTAGKVGSPPEKTTTKPKKSATSPSNPSSAPQASAPVETADESSPAASAAADALFEQGHEAMQKHDYDLACSRFRESDRLEPAVGSKFNLANCEQQRGRVATAVQLFRVVVSNLPADDDRVPIANARIRDLEPKVPKLTFQLASGEGENVTVRGGGVTFRHASFGIPLPFDPGKHRFVVEAPGHRSRTYDIEVRPAETRVLTVRAGSKTERP